MSGDAGSDEEGRGRLRSRLEAGLRRVTFFVLPSAVAFIAIGDVVGGVVYRSGRFGRAENLWLWGTLAASAVGLLAATMGRLYSTTLFALQDARTPQHVAVARVLVSAALSLTGALWLGHALGLDPRWNVALLALGSAVAAWVEWALLRRSVDSRIGAARVGAGHWGRLVAAAATATAVGVGMRWLLGGAHSLGAMLVVIATYALAYLAVALALGVPEARALLGRPGARRP